MFTNQRTYIGRINQLYMECWRRTNIQKVKETENKYTDIIVFKYNLQPGISIRSEK